MRRSLFLDIQAIQSREHARRGIARYVAGQASALIRIPGLVRSMGLNPLMPFPRHLDDELLRSDLLTWTTSAAVKGSATGDPLFYYLMSPLELGPPTESVVLPEISAARIPLILTLYDLIPLLRPELYLSEPRFARHYRARLELFKTADLVLTISEHSRNEALEHLGLAQERVVTIGTGISSIFQPAQPDDGAARIIERQLPEIRRPFVLSVSGADPRKNTDRLIQAFGLLPTELKTSFQLVITCQLSQPFRRQWFEAVREAGLEAGTVIFTDTVSDQLLRALYQQAYLFVFPSLHEGFGLPAAEAAASGCPTITSGTSSLPEVLNFQPSTFDPTEVESIAERIELGLTDVDFRDRLIEAGRKAATLHTWESVAERTRKALEAIDLEQRELPASWETSSNRVALIGPLPPTPSGIADYNSRMAGELAKFVDVDLIGVGNFDRKCIADNPRLRCFPIKAWGSPINPASYDAVIYSFGNSDHHIETYSAALTFPGLIWLHDVRLAGFYQSYASALYGQLGTAQFMIDKLRLMYGPRAPEQLLVNPLASQAEYSELGVGMTRELVQSARAVIVNSKLAKRLLVLDQGAESRTPPVFVLPLAVPSIGQLPRLPNGESDIFNSTATSSKIVSAGIVTRWKAPQLLIEAFGKLGAECPAELIFAGPVEPSFKNELEEQAQAIGVGDRVAFTGYLERADYWQQLADAHCAVQIRDIVTGENSAAVNDALGAGIPVITNVLSCRELPSGTVDFIDGDLTASTLATRIRRILRDEEIRKRCVSSALLYAQERTFEAAAKDLLEAAISSSKGRQHG